MKRFLLSLFMLLALSGFAFAATDLNTATKAELEAVKGIGPVKAEAIIEYRMKNGPFITVDDLKAVKGFGDKTVAKMRSEIYVSGAPASNGTKKAAKAANK